MAFTYSWSTIADGAIDPDSPIDTALMTALRNNVVYAYEYTGGKSYTPAEPHTHDGVNSALIATVANGGITEPKLAAAAVSQGKVKTTTGDVTDTSSGGASGANYVLPGGEYGFYILSWASGIFNGTGSSQITNNYQGASPTTIIYLKADANSNGNTLNARQRYIQASGPYNLGNGDVPLFQFARIDRLGNVRGVYVATDPPWAYNGPTRLAPDLVRPDGRKYRRVYRTPADRRLGRFDLVEITMAVKNADMPLIPHPFLDLKPDETVVLLDPLGGITLDLLDRHESGESVSEMIARGGLIIDNTPCGANAPPGVIAVGCRWRNTP